MSTELQHRGNIPQAMAWMIGLSAVLFWMPVVGGLVAGFVGGRKAGTPGRAIIAAILPGLIFGLLVFFVGGLIGWIPLIGQLFAAVAGLGGFVLSFMNVVPLLIGAALGGWMSDRAVA